MLTSRSIRVVLALSLGLLIVSGVPSISLAQDANATCQPAKETEGKRCDAKANGAIVQGRCSGGQCNAEKAPDTKGDQQQVKDSGAQDSQKAAQEAASTVNQEPSKTSGQNGAPNDYSGVQGQNGSPSGNAIADTKSNTGWGEMTSGAKGDQLFQQLGREAAARGEPGIGYTNTSNNGSISNGQVVFYGDKNDIAAINDLAQNGDAYTADYFKPVDCWACNDPRFQGGQASTDFLRDNIASGNVMEPERFRLTSDGIDYLVSAAEARQFVSAITELSTFGPSWSAAQSFGTWSGDFSYRPPVSPFGMNSASFSNGLGGVMTNGLGSANCSSGVCVVSGQGGVVQPVGSGIAAPQPPSNLTAEQKAEWLRAFNQASASCGSDMLCRMAAQQTASQAVQAGTTNADALASYMDKSANPVKAAFTQVTNAARAAWDGLTDGLSAAWSGSDSSGEVQVAQDTTLSMTDDGFGVPSRTAPPFADSPMSSDRTGLPADPRPSGSILDTQQSAEDVPFQTGQVSCYGSPACGDSKAWADSVTDSKGQSFDPDVDRIVAVPKGSPFQYGDKVEITRFDTDGNPIGSTVATVRDVCPGDCHGGRIGDLTTAAAQDIGLDKQIGLANVSMEKYDPAVSSLAQSRADYFRTALVDQAQADQALPRYASNNSESFFDPRAGARSLQETSVFSGEPGRTIADAPYSFEVIRPSSAPVDSVSATDFGASPLQDIGPQDVARPGGFTATSLSALTDLPGESASPFDLGRASVSEVAPSFVAPHAVAADVLTATPPTSLAVLSESAPVYGTVSSVGAPSDTVVAQDDVEFNEQYFNMSGRRTDSDPGGDTSALDVANPRQTALGPQPVGNVGQAVPDALPQYANREEQAAYTRRSTDAGYQADTPTASRWGFYAPNPLGAPGYDNFYYPSPTPQLGGGPLAQSESWTHMPADVPSPFISQTEGDAFPRTVSLTTPGAQDEASLNATETNFQQTGSLQPPLATPNTVLGSPANTAYAPTGNPDPATIPVVDQSAADKELADFKAQQDARPNSADAADTKPKDQPATFMEKLGQYADDVKQKISDAFGVSVVGKAEAPSDEGSTSSGRTDTQPLTSVPGIEVAPPSADDIAGTRGIAAQPGSAPDAPGQDPQSGAGQGQEAGDAGSGTVPPAPDLKTPGSKYVDGLNGAIPGGANASQMSQDQDTGESKTIAGFDQPKPSTASSKTVDATPPAAGPAAVNPPPSAPGVGGPDAKGRTNPSASSGGTGAGGALGLLNSVLGLAKSAMGGQSGQGSGGSKTPTTPVQANPETVLATPVPSTQFPPQKPLTDAPQISVVANPNPVDAGAASTISWRAQWAHAQNASTTRECAVADVTGAIFVEHGAESGSVETPVLTHGAYYLIGCKQSDGKLGSTKILVSVKGDTQPPVAPPSLSAAPSTSDAATDLQNALYGAAPAAGAAPAPVDDRPQPVNVACDPNSSQYFSCLTGKMQFVDKLY